MHLDKQIEKLEKLQEKFKDLSTHTFLDSNNEENADEIKREIIDSIDAYIEILENEIELAESDRENHEE